MSRRTGAMPGAAAPARTACRVQAQGAADPLQSGRPWTRPAGQGAGAPADAVRTARPATGGPAMPILAGRSGRRRAGLALCGALLLAGCFPPEGVSEEDLAAFDTAVASIGCDLGTEAQYQPVEWQTGLPRATLVEIAQYRVSRDEAVMLSNGGVRLVTGPCTPTEPAPEQTPAA